MTEWLSFLGMDVEAMTVNDWLGVFFALVAFFGMVAAYLMVFWPSNKAKFEEQRYMALEDEDPIKLERMR